MAIYIKSFLSLTHVLLLALILSWSVAGSAAESAKNGDAPINQNTADSILKELKEIRQVLEKIEKQGGIAAAARTPSPADHREGLYKR